MMYDVVIWRKDDDKPRYTLCIYAESATVAEEKAIQSMLKNSSWPKKMRKEERRAMLQVMSVRPVFVDEF